MIVEIHLDAKVILFEAFFLYLVHSGQRTGGDSLDCGNSTATKRAFKKCQIVAHCDPLREFNLTARGSNTHGKRASENKVWVPVFKGYSAESDNFIFKTPKFSKSSKVAGTPDVINNNTQCLAKSWLLNKGSSAAPGGKKEGSVVTEPQTLLVSWGEDHEEASPAKPVGDGDAARVQVSPSLELSDLRRKEKVAVANLSEAVQDADLLVFVIPHQFIHRICEEITGRVAKDALGITLIKLGALDFFGSKVMENGLLFKELLQTPNFRITVVDDADTVEVCGALKNIVAVGAGFCDGLRCGDNTKAAVIRLGLMEMIAFARFFCKGQVSTATFLESCGVADLITTCYGGRNRRVAEAFARTGKTIEELEKEMLNGQKLQGPQTSAEVYRILKKKGLLDKFPLFTAVYQICYEGRPVQEMLSCLQSHPEHT
ncbi:hypothetical protein E2I00_008630 [Balaenoptera physalus]|uniref:Glycerol-3-phosphate dehydrogenase (NAD(+)) n=1 Tax=Balaenoptera physalus TaxID=9770 RepID=A0A643C990_BALPH|nr:hypothetical protein E2I00_008630 [Balaenoptera physalus]